MNKLDTKTTSQHIRMTDYAWNKLVLLAKCQGLTVSKYLETFARNKKINM